MFGSQTQDNSARPAHFLAKLWRWATKYVIQAGWEERARRLAAMPAEPVLLVLPVRPEDETTAQAIATLEWELPVVMWC